MDKKICLDTDFCIAILKQQPNYEDLLKSILFSKTFITSVSVFELLLRKTNIYQIESFIKDLNLLNFDSRAARKASDIQKELMVMGKIVDIRDLFIASTAITNNCTLATLNRKHFENIKGLKLLDL